MFEKDKIRYAAECYPRRANSRKRILSSLLLLKEYETEWNMDFTMQDLDKLQAAFNNAVSTSKVGAKNALTRFRKYAKWRTENNLPCTQNVFKLEIDRLVSIRESMVSSPQHLARILDIVFDDSVLGTMDVIYRIFLWMGFSGIDDIEAVTVTRQELDFKQLLIRHNGNTYAMYRESRYDFRIACDLTDFLDEDAYISRSNGDTIMRGKSGKEPLTPSRYLLTVIRPTLARKFELATQQNLDLDSPEDIGLDLSFHRVYMSGVFYRLYQQELIGNPPDFYEYAQKEFEQTQLSDKPYKISPTKNPKAAIILRLKKKIETDYVIWKQAFNL